MKFLPYLVFSLLMVACSKGDSDGNSGPDGNGEQGPLGRTFRGNVLLTSHQEIDDFGTEKYVDVTGNFTIDDSGDPSTILDLSPPSQLQRVVGSIYIQGNDSLRAISGFQAL